MIKEDMKKILNVPNILSFFRLLCVLVFLLVFFWFTPNYIPALIVFVIASLTDAIDGFVARKYNQITSLGVVLDPLADKFLKMSALFAFAFNGIVEWWLFGVLCGIDLAMIIAGIVLFKREITIPSNIIGKTGTLVMSIGLIMCFFPQELAPLNEYTLYVGLGIIISSVILYVALNFKTCIKKMKEYGKNRKQEKEAKKLLETEKLTHAEEDIKTEEEK